MLALFILSQYIYQHIKSKELLFLTCFSSNHNSNLNFGEKSAGCFLSTDRPSAKDNRSRYPNDINFLLKQVECLQKGVLAVKLAIFCEGYH